jgi:membrane associated rhomboid family serine protease
MILPIQAKYFVFIMGGIAFLSAISSANTGISEIAHLGGMAFGYFFLRKKFPHPTAGLKKAYYEWKLKRARRKFIVYLNKKEKDQKKGPTIH